MAVVGIRLARNINGPMRNGKSGSRSALGNPGQCAFCAPEGKPKFVVNVVYEEQLATASNPSSGGNPTVATCGSRASLSACIKTLESTLSALPAGGPFEATRLYLQIRFPKRKKEITESKPLAMRFGVMQGRRRQSRCEEYGLSRSSGTCDTRVSTCTTERARAGGGIGFLRETAVRASLAGQIQRCSGRRQFSGVVTNLHEISTARHGHELCSTAKHGRRGPETHGTTLHVPHHTVSTVTGRQSWCKAVGFTDVTVQPSADSLLLERGAQTGQILWAPVERDPANRLLGQRSVGEKIHCTMRRWSTGTDSGTIFINSSRDGKKKRCSGKRQVTQIQAFSSGDCHCECRHLASSRGVTVNSRSLRLGYMQLCCKRHDCR